MTRTISIPKAGLLAAVIPVVLLVAHLSSPVAGQVPGNPSKPVLVELFTSEGCSSCPPADALLRSINGTQTPDGQMIIGISEHVTYWNQLGWKDPYSGQVFTDRQEAYSNHFKLDSVYTPQIVIGGDEQFVGSDRAGLQRALRHQAQQPRLVDLKIVAAKVAGTSLKLTLSTALRGPAPDADLIAVIADDADQSSVQRGENAGQTLAHVAVARSLTHIAKLKPAVSEQMDLPLPASFVASQRHHVVVFAQELGNGRVLAVDARPI